MSEIDQETKRRALRERLEIFKRDRARLLGERFYMPLKEEHYQNSITLEKLPLVKELRVQEKSTFPFALFIVLALLTEQAVLCLDNINFLAPLALKEDETRILHTVAYKSVDRGQEISGAKFEIYSAYDKNISKWTLHCSGFIQTGIFEGFYPKSKIDIAEWKRRFPTPVDFKPIYDQLRKAGTILGEDLCSITEAWKNNTTLIAHISLPLEKDSNEYTYSIPALLEACFHSVLGLFAPPNLQAYGLKIISIKDFTFEALPKSAIWCGVTKSDIVDEYLVDISILNDKGSLLGVISGMRFEYCELKAAENNL